MHYPAGATTHSDLGVKDIGKTYAALERMQALGMPLLVHGESVRADIDVFDLETITVDLTRFQGPANAKSKGYVIGVGESKTFPIGFYSDAKVDAWTVKVYESNPIFGPPKTKRLVGILKTLGVDSALLVDSKDNKNLSKSAANLQSHRYLAPEGLNVYDILRHPGLVIAADAIKKIEARVTAEPAA